MIHLFLKPFLLILFFASAWAQEQTAPYPCNGSTALCDRRYDQVVYPTTHNATSMKLGYGPSPILVVPNQDRTIEAQLNDGIRAFMIDIWYWRGEVYTCHRYCRLGGQPLLGIMQTFEKFLKENKNEVVTIIFENYVDGADVEQVFIEAGLASLVHAHVKGQPWPTLRQMISENRRLVVFKEHEETSRENFGPAWYMLAWDHVVETVYSYTKMKQYTCEYNRGNAENSLYIVNQFISVALFRREANRRSNQYWRLMNRAHDCFLEKQKIPNFLTVDFYDSGDLIEVVKNLNAEWSEADVEFAKN